MLKHRRCDQGIAEDIRPSNRERRNGLIRPKPRIVIVRREEPIQSSRQHRSPTENEVQANEHEIASSCDRIDLFRNRFFIDLLRFIEERFHRSSCFLPFQLRVEPLANRRRWKLGFDCDHLDTESGCRFRHCRG